jgi:hypothetical protein
LSFAEGSFGKNRFLIHINNTKITEYLTFLECEVLAVLQKKPLRREPERF